MTADIAVKDRIRNALQSSADNPLPLFAGPETTGKVPFKQQGRNLERGRIEGDITEIENVLPDAVSSELSPEDQDVVMKLRDRLGKKQKGLILLDQAEIDPKEYIADQVGGKFSGGALDDLGLRADLSLSDTFTEKRNKFLTKYPDGDMIMVDRAPVVQGANNRGKGGQTILLRRNGDDEYIELDSDSFELADMADLTGDIPNIAGEAAGIFLTRGTNIIKQAIMAGLGDIVGETAEEAVEALRGFQTERLDELAGRMTSEGALVTAGTGVMAPLSGPIRAFDKGTPGIRGTLKNSGKAQQFAKEQGLPPLRVDQISNNPILKRLGMQSEATVSVLADDTRVKNEALIDTLLSLREPDVKRFLRGELAEIHEDAIKQVKAAIPAVEGDLRSAGDAIHQGLVQYEKLSRAVVDTKYAKARKSGEVTFDLSPALQVAKELEEGVPLPKVGGGAIDSEPLHPAVAEAIGLLKQVDFNAPTETIAGRVYSPVERLRTVVQKLDDVKAFGNNPLALEKDQSARVAARQANKLFAAVQHVLKNPQSGDPAVMKMYQEAAEEASKRFKTLQDIQIKNILSTEAGRKSNEIAGALATPGKGIDDLRYIRDVLTQHDKSGKKFAEFRNGVLGDLTDRSKIMNLKQTLDQYSEEQRQILFPGDTWSKMQDLATQVERMKLLDIENTLIRQSDQTKVLGDMINTDNTGAIKRLTELMPKDPEDLRRKSMRAAVVDDILSKSIKLDRKNPGVRVLDEIELERQIDRLRENGAIEILTKGDVETLENAGLYSGFLGVASDAGTSLQAAQTAAELREIISFRGGGAGAMITIAEAYGTARLLMSPKFQSLIKGSSNEAVRKRARNTADMINLSAAIMATLNDDIQGYTESEKVTEQ